MKNFLFYSAAFLAVVSCTSNNEDPIVEPEEQVVKIVDATIEVSYGESSTRAFLGTATMSASGKYSITHSFEENDGITLYDYSGSYPFTVQRDGQTTTISGRWAEIEHDTERDGILAMFPSSAVKSSMTRNSENHPVMHFSLPTSQTSRVINDGISYAQSAGLAFASAETKTATLWFCPVVSYLYFYSECETCRVVSSQNIAGTYDVTWSADHGTGTNADHIEYNTAEGINNYLTYSATEKSINCTGKIIENHKNKFNDEYNAYEYIICIKPGIYQAGELMIYPGSSTECIKNTEKFTLLPSNLYYLGCVDKP